MLLQLLRSAFRGRSHLSADSAPPAQVQSLAQPAPDAKAWTPSAAGAADLMRNIESFHHLTHLHYQATCWSIRRDILAEPRNAAPLRLEPFGYKVYSQSDEDGYIAEIFQRIGVTNRCCVEIGAGDGQENNSVTLLMQGWTVKWLEAQSALARVAQERFGEMLRDGRLAVIDALIDRDNLPALLASLNLPAEPDLLSIDIDGNDYHVWKAVASIRPRVVVIEYNAKYPPPIEWVMPYDARHGWDGSDHVGASLQSLTNLAAEKGYALVGCNITGVNAFFVRNEFAADRFQRPYTAANHYHPARYFLANSFISGHPPSLRYL